MTRMACTHTSRVRAGAGLLAIRQWLRLPAWIFRIARRRKEARLLLAMDDRLLADIGLTRRDVHRALCGWDPNPDIDASREQNATDMIGLRSRFGHTLLP